ncbi:MAG: hypothetical protein K2Q97_02070 [Burkholderiaceae bacterium]|nr:hypothetical protein [Burkholderiaceae bacterium]
MTTVAVLHGPVIRIRASMRRLLLIFLLVFAPFQFIWAAASPYCEHEATPKTAHFGHHEHEHGKHGGAKAGLVELTNASATLSEIVVISASAADMDCHACHGAGTAVAWGMSAQAIVVTVARPDAQVAPFWRLPPLSRPERPKWPALA